LPNMEVLTAILMISASVSLIAIAGAVWYLVIRISFTLDRMLLSMERIADDAEETFKKINRLTERIDSTLTPIERMVQGFSILTVASKVLGLFASRKRRG